MTRAQIRTLVLSYLDDMSGTYFTSAQVNVWIDLAQKRVQQMLLQAGENYYLKPVETTLVVGQADYVLPDDFFVLHRLEIVISGTGSQENRQAIVPITTNQQGMVSIASGTPSCYAIKKDRITLSPTPDAALIMRIYYSPMVADITGDSASPDIPVQFHELVAILAALDGFIKDDRSSENLMAKKADYEKLLEQMKNERRQDSPRMIVMTESYDFGSVF